MIKAKQEVKNLLSRLPENCSLEDVQYHLYVIQKVNQGLLDIKNGRYYTQQQIEKKWQNGPEGNLETLPLTPLHSSEKFCMPAIPFPYSRNVAA